MGAYVIRRVLVMIGTLIALSVIVFLLFSVLPADPARLTCGKSCTPSIIAANRHRLGLDAPLPVQYQRWVVGIAVGRTYNEGQGVAEFKCAAPCLGYSFSQHEDVTPMILGALPPTAFLAFGAFIVWMITGVGTGIIAALNRGRWPDKILQGIALVGYSLPTFFVGEMLLIFIVVKFGLLPYPNYVSPFEDPGVFFQTMLLPWIGVALASAAFYTRLTRTQMVETLGEDYIRTARAKGLGRWAVILRHALRAGLTPIVTAAGLDLGILLGGAIITEYIYNIPGVGRLAIASVLDSDLPVIAGVTMFAATFIMVSNLLVDILYGVIDPRVRLK
jgi:peptide/nickel transport system permease protein